MLYIYFLLYSVHLIIYRGTGNRWAVCAHRWACLLVFVGDSPDGGRCMLIGGRASGCWLVIVQTVGGVCSSVGVPPGVGG